MRRLSMITLTVGCLVVMAGPASAAWPDDLDTNTPVDTLGAQDPEVVADGAGGVYMAWTTGRFGAAMVMAQHFDPGGNALWAANGLMVAPAAAVGQATPRLSFDGAGGVFVVWSTYTTAFAQRLSSSGTLQWGLAGVPVGPAGVQQGSPIAVSDGAGGMILAWKAGGILAQRLDGSGNALWPAAGVPLGPNFALLPRMVPDGAGGAIVTWFGSSSGQYGANDIYAQRVSAAGQPLWGATGAVVCSAAGSQSYEELASDGADGAIIAWTDSRGGQNWADFDDIYAQRINGSGVAQWTPDGVGVCTAPGWQSDVVVLADGGGGAILAWDDHRGDSTHVFAQRLDGAGAGQWGANGIGLHSGDAAQILPVLAADGAGGAFVAWMDHRSGEFQTYGQRLSPNGLQSWGPGGKALSNATGRQDHQRIAWAGAGSVVTAWSDYRGSTDEVSKVGVYAQGVRASGPDGPPTSGLTPSGGGSIALALAGSNPTRGGDLSVRFTLRGDEPARLDVFDLSGRLVMTQSVTPLGRGSHTLRLSVGGRFVPGIYLLRLREGTNVRTARAVCLN